MATAGPSLPTVAAQVAPGVAWDEVDGALADGVAQAFTEAMATEDTSAWLKLTAFGFSIPDGATITAVSVAVDCAANGSGQIQLTGAVLVVGGSLQAEDVLGGTGDNLTNSPTYSDLTVAGWDVSGLSVAQANAAGFGVAIRFTAIDVPGLGDDKPLVDSVTVTITYAELSGVASRSMMMGMGR